MTTCIRVAWRMLHEKILATALLSYLSQFCVSQVSPRTTTFCVWLPLPHRLSLGELSPTTPCSILVTSSCASFLLWTMNAHQNLSSRLPDSVWEFYAGGQRSGDWGKEISTSFFPVAVLWALSISTVGFNLQCLTPSIICSVILSQIWYNLHGKDKRIVINPGMIFFLNFFINSEFCPLFLTTV